LVLNNPIPSGNSGSGGSVIQTSYGKEDVPSAQKAMNSVLARLVNLAQLAMRAESAAKAGDVIVNGIHHLIKTDRAAVVPLFGNKRVLCISGHLEASQDNPFSQAIHEARKLFRKAEEPVIVKLESLPENARTPQLMKVLEGSGGTSVLWVNLPHPGGGEPRFALWLERWNRKPWPEEEIKLLSHSLVFFGYSLGTSRKTIGATLLKKRVLWLVLAVLIAMMWLPVHSNVNAPVQMVPDHPYYVFAPFDGVVEELAVQPGERVEEGDLIFRYDTRILEKQLDEALRGVAVAQAELARLEGAAYMDEEARARIPVQKLEVQRKEAEVAFLRKQLELAEVRTDADGVVVLDNPDALIGASLQTGQMVLRIADPQRSKMRIMVPVSDAGLVREDAPVSVRLDSNPLRSIPAQVYRIGFDVELSDERVPSVLVEAEPETDQPVMPGQRGTAKITGPRVTLGMQIFRKPLMDLRNFLGV
jgi:hypothetical protein